jgi:hypothetical protein
LPDGYENEPIDKTFTARSPGAGVAWVAQSGQFGMRGTSRCQVDPAIWNQNCVVPAARFDRVFIDVASCAAASPVLQDMFINAYFDLEFVLRNEVGWNIARTFDSNAANIIYKCDPTLGSGGQGSRPTDFCWNMPGYPQDVCFFTNKGGLARVGLTAIQASLGTGLSAKRATFNIGRHELLHTLGWGHFPGENDIMNTSQPSNVITDLSASQIDMMRNFWPLGQGPTPHYCNWLPGDPVGASCPHSVPAL